MKRNIFKYLLLLLILPAVTLAQDFDKSFLESLPEDVSNPDLGPYEHAARVADWERALGLRPRGSLGLPGAP